MKTIGLMGLIGVIGLMSAEARIGDTKAECRERYHDASIPTRFDNLFIKGGVTTDCLFEREGKCVSVSYRIVFLGTVKDLGRGPEFNAVQVEKLLALNSGGSEWEKKAGDPTANPWDGVYVTKDGSRQAKVNFTGVTVQLVAHYEKQKALTTPEAVGGVVDGFVK